MIQFRLLITENGFIKNINLHIASHSNEEIYARDENLLKSLLNTINLKR